MNKKPLLMPRNLVKDWLNFVNGEEHVWLSENLKLAGLVTRLRAYWKICTVDYGHTISVFFRCFSGFEKLYVLFSYRINELLQL